MTRIETPGARSIEEVCRYLRITADRTVKTLIVEGERGDGDAVPLVALVVRGDHTLNEIKAEKLAGVAQPLRMADEAVVARVIGCKPGSIGPVGLSIPIIVDRSVAQLADFVCGANEEGWHLTGVNWQRDLPLPEVADLRNVEAGDPSPDGQGTLQIRRGIEVGHIFQLGTKYSEALNARVLNEEGKEQVMIMGCYGIGVSRVVAAAIEQNHDERGIIWPLALAPFQIAIVPLNAQKSDAVKAAAEQLYQELTARGYDVLLDDRNERPGVKFADIDLIGIPHRIVVGDRGLNEGNLEYKGRRDAEPQAVPCGDAVEFLVGLLDQH